MLCNRWLFFLVLLLAGCSALNENPTAEGRRRSLGNWPLGVLADGDTAPVFSGTSTLQYYFVCQTEYLPTAQEIATSARWKVNFVNFTKPTADLFDGDTQSVDLAAGVVYDRRGGWFLVVPIVDRIAGACGITVDGVIFVRRDLFRGKLGDGLVRCKYKYPNPDGDPAMDEYFDSDMTLVGVLQPKSGRADHAGAPK